MREFSVGIDSYSLYPLQLTPLEVLRWAGENGARGVQFSGLFPEQRQEVDAAYLKDLSSFAAQAGLYLEWGGGGHIPYDTQSWQSRDIMAVNRRAAQEAALLGSRVIRSCSGGLMRWRPDSPMTETLLQESAAALKAQRAMLKDHNVILAIETHFEFTSHELLRLFQLCDAEPGDYLGICLDTMNLLTMLEEPLAASERLLPWVVCTHLKDGGMLPGPDGLVTFPCAINRGMVDLAAILQRLSLLPWEVTLSIEDHTGSFDVPIFDPLFLAKFPDLTVQELAKLMKLSRETAAAVESGRIEILEREAWPGLCEARLRRDIRSLQELVGEIAVPTD
jgi:sugar phosphate isomerase/epimerase